MPSQRLSPDAWTQAALAALPKDGPTVLRAETLARAIGTTKGSFYWHFKDVPAFHHAIATRWKADALAAMQGREADPRRALRGLRLTDAPATERAMRAWAVSSDAAAAALAEVDDLRLRHVTALLAAIGLSNPDFARLILAAHIGALHLDPTRAEAALGTMVDLVMTLDS